MLARMDSVSTTPISVIDFRRHSMVLQWYALSGTWSAYDSPPPLVHGVALIRASEPNICIYGHAGRLRLQVGADQYALSETSLRIRCTGLIATLGFRRRFTVESSATGVLFNYSYWSVQGGDFFHWLAARAQDPDWRTATARQWSEGVPAATLRAG